MHQLDQKKLLIERILPYLIGAPNDAVQRLLQESVSDLETILGDCITKKARAEAVEQVKQHTDDLHRDSQLEGAFVHACMAVINNRRLAPCESNRAMLESLLNPGETASTKLYVALAEQFQPHSGFAPESRRAELRNGLSNLAEGRQVEADRDVGAFGRSNLDGG